MNDGLGNYIVDGALQNLPVPTRNVRVLHTPQRPNGFLLGAGACVAIGTGPFNGYAWLKVTPGTTYTDWVPLMVPNTTSGGSSAAAGVPTTPGP